MLRPRPDLDAIDRELEQLGQAREDVAELVAKYTASGLSMPPLDREPAPEDARSEDQPSDDAQDLDHDDFELLVDDSDMDRVEDDELESVA
jgi:hypothetical protein